MSRKYEKVNELLPIIKDLTAQGKTQQQIAEQLGFLSFLLFKEFYDVNYTINYLFGQENLNIKIYISSSIIADI